MNEKEIFDNLFALAKDLKDPEGVVVAGLVKDGKVLVSSPSASDGVRHAEDLVIEKARKLNVKIDDSMLLVTTLEPDSYRTPGKGVKDSTTIILDAGIKNVLFAVPDPDFGKESRKRFEKAGVNYNQVSDIEIIRKAVNLFNSTIEIPITSMGLPRAKKMP
jgi:pyrimidine deaminase RibD-like protein